jgi:putative DNA-invertase from lambdoid prophage Rac
MDVRATVERLGDMQVPFHCLALGGVDFTSASGKMTMPVIAAVAELKLNLLVEPTKLACCELKLKARSLGPSDFDVSRHSKVNRGMAAKSQASGFGSSPATRSR